MISKKDVLAAIALAAISLASRADPQYTVTDIGTPSVSGAASQGFGISSSGNFAYGRSLAGSAGPAWVWSSESGRIDWTMPSPQKYGPASGAGLGGVNNFGLAVSSLGTSIGGGTVLPEMWSASTSTVTPLSLLSGYTTGRAADINDSGKAVGYQGSGTTQKAVMWDTGTNTVSVITTLTADGAYMTTPMSINNAGQVLGLGRASDGTTVVPLLYDSLGGTMAQLDLSGAGSGGVSVYNLSENGMVTGSVGSTAFLWSASGGARAIPTLAGNASTMTGYAVNSSGWVVGRQGSSSFLFDGTTTYDLSTLIAGSGWSVTSSSASTFGIADNGSIVATGISGSNIHALVLTAVPEPSSWALMVIGMAVVGTVARRRPAKE